jgi:hypothetical protein
MALDKPVWKNVSGWTGWQKITMTGSSIYGNEEVNVSIRFRFPESAWDLSREADHWVVACSASTDSSSDGATFYFTELGCWVEFMNTNAALTQTIRLDPHTLNAYYYRVEIVFDCDAYVDGQWDGSGTMRLTLEGRYRPQLSDFEWPLSRFQQWMAGVRVSCSGVCGLTYYSGHTVPPEFNIRYSHEQAGFTSSRFHEVVFYSDGFGYTFEDHYPWLDAPVYHTYSPRRKWYSQKNWALKAGGDLFFENIMKVIAVRGSEP